MIKLILKGAMMGVANIIPGVSGGTMAVSMGIYDKIIHAATHLVSEFKKSMKLLLPIVLGMALGIVVLARILEYFFFFCFFYRWAAVIYKEGERQDYPSGAYSGVPAVFRRSGRSCHDGRTGGGRRGFEL